jgi:Fe2+ transport system protein FeoA
MPRRSASSPSSPADPKPAVVRLTQLTDGAVARFDRAEVAEDDHALLRALGLTSHSVVRICKAGEPCIVQVRATRIGLSRVVADGILVVPHTAT